MSDDGYDPERRFLCPEGVCIGVIALTGYCGTCGRPIAASERSAFEQAHGIDLGTDFRPTPTDPVSEFAGDPNLTVPQSAAEELTPRPETPNAENEMEPDLDQRVLCSDGACIGIIGPHGLCNTCGKPPSLTQEST